MHDFNTKLIHTMLIERQNKVRSGVYALTQREFAYNSNKIEGSRLTKEHTNSLFDTGSIYSEGEYRAKDIEEATGHFVMFNAMLDTLKEPLSEDLIKYFHKCLKQGVFEDIANGYAIGEYKTRVNYVGEIQTAHPSQVAALMKELLEQYNQKVKNIETLAWLHAHFEKIHPFQDGNGRTGRILLYRECLVHQICPFLIRDENKARYVNALYIAQTTEDHSKLVNYFEEEQDWYRNKVEEALI